MSAMNDALIAAGLPVARPLPSRTYPALAVRPLDRQCLKRRAILALYDDGMTWRDIVTMLHVSHETIGDALRNRDEEAA